MTDLAGDTIATDIGSTTTDKEYINALAPLGASYMAAASAWFFAHYGPDSYDKNVSYQPPPYLTDRLTLVDS